MPQKPSCGPKESRSTSTSARRAPATKLRRRAPATANGGTSSSSSSKPSVTTAPQHGTPSSPARMPSPKHAFDRVPTSDPYDFEEGGSKQQASSSPPEKMGPARRLVKRIGYGRAIFLATLTLGALYLYLGGARPAGTEAAVVTEPAVAQGEGLEWEGGVGGPATKTDEQGMPVAPALDEHRFDHHDDAEQSKEDRPKRPIKKPMPLGAGRPVGSHPTPTLNPVDAECVVPEGKAESQYALMIDAGSTGSRIHVYKFSYCPKNKSAPTDGAAPAAKEEAKAPKDKGTEGSEENEEDEAEEDDEQADEVQIDDDADEQPNGRHRVPLGKRARKSAPRPPAAAVDDTFRTTQATSSPPEGARLPALESELFFKLQPGLSSYAGKPRDAAESLRPLLEEAVKGVPKDLHSCTPIAVKATAGLRLLGEKESREILEEVESWLKKEFSFPLVRDGVVIMDGKDEGVYAWVTINYLLHLIGPTTAANATAAVMDLGGASTQIVFEPTFPDESTALAPGEHRYELSFSGTTHPLYQHSHLGYGLMQARRSVHNFVAFTHLWQSHTSPSRIPDWDDLTEDVEVPSPCLSKGGKKVIELDPPGRKSVKVTFIGTGAGFEACRRLVDVVMAKDAICPVEPCAFGGVYQPRLMDTFQGPIYALSYFFDRIAPLGLASPFRISDLRKLTDDVCYGPGSDAWRRFKGNKEAEAELADRPEYCLDLSFMYSLLAFGYELAEEREIVISKKIDGVELGWALGAAIAMLDGDISCKA